MAAFLSSLATGDPLTDMLIGAPVGLLAAAILLVVGGMVRDFASWIDDVLYAVRRARKSAARIEELQARLR